MLDAKQRLKTVGRAGLDSKKRLSLAKALRELRAVVGDRVDELIFRIDVNDIGQIVLSPELAIPAHEIWLYQNRDALEAVRRGLQDAEEGKTVRRGSFAKYAEGGQD